ncbi:hypothetical protein [Mesohalobacter halotolerans]|jgi:hypothetical protein|uniref:Uncharacterized protein n=1 Tax=Mesohalobacter halotolerans TaxID=1883405 RepID=A0A4U5TS31_9FLAO|nr:hypothetical protein [Mesohalobacter halotolerans]TKS56214.1 hypothetical protein FCN74_09400 [Mesohalobacter halotolerans]
MKLSFAQKYEFGYVSYKVNYKNNDKAVLGIATAVVAIARNISGLNKVTTKKRPTGSSFWKLTL